MRDDPPLLVTAPTTAKRGLTNGFKNVDYADVAFDTFGTSGSSAILDAAIDVQLNNSHGPTIAIVVYNKDVGISVNQAASNYLINNIPGIEINDLVTPALGQLGEKVLQTLPGFN